jgi:predicted nucleotidyltransferase component of viral defense system
VTKRPVTNLPASIRDRLLKLAHAGGLNFQLVLVRYYQERLLARIEVSRYSHNFTLKGGFLLYALALGDTRQIARPTRDVDFRAQGIPSSPDSMRVIFQEICATPISDGVVFDVDQITAQAIIEDAIYPGVRVRIPASLSGTRDVVQVDIGFGDVVTPGPREMEFPILLEDMTVPRVQVYSKETVIAEKFEAMISLALVNGRLKDFFDVYQLAHADAFDGALLQEAVANTFHHRGTGFDLDHPIFDDTFSTDPVRQRHWNSFVRRTGLDAAPEQFAHVIVVVRLLLFPIFEGCAAGGGFSGTWSPDTLTWRMT